MIQSRTQLRTWFTALCSAAALLACGIALADPPGRAARLTQISGAVSFAPAGEQEWVPAQPNRPLISGDSVWSDASSRAELQIGTASARLGSTTSVTLLNLDDTIAQLQLAQGTLNLHVRRIYPGQVFEIDAPNLAFSVRRPGDYRVDVDPAGNATIIRVRSGQGEAWGEGVAYTVDPGQQYTFTGEGLRDYSYDPLPPPDEFDSWTGERDQREERAVAMRYVSPDIVGYSDLDDNGSWRSVASYGNVWFPTRVAADWAPYRDGHWAWVDPWGWTWVDDQPWGFAPFHYGRWCYVGSRWGWVPGPIAVRPVYAPALVAFIGGGGFSLSISTGPVQGVAWFPLGPGDVYRPAYAASRSYFNNVNVSNTVVNTTVINNVYNNVNVTNVVYKNREAPGAVTAVPTAAFTSAEPVQRHAIQVPKDVIARQAVSPVAAVTPTRASVLAVAGVAAGGAAIAAAKRPPAAVLARPVVAKTPPPPPPPPFAAKASLLAAQPGRPLEQEKLKSLPAAHGVEASKVKVVAPTVQPQPLSKEGAGTGRRAATPGSPAANVQQPPPSVQERMLKENKAPPPPSGAQEKIQKAPPPPPVQERMQKENKVQPPPPPPPVQERMQKENKVQPPPPPVQERMQKENKVQPPPPPVQERMQKENKVQPPPPPVQERMQKENKVQPPPPPVQERMQKENKVQPPPPPVQERMQKEYKAPPPPPPAQERMQKEYKAPPPPPPAQERMQKAPPPPPPAAKAPPPPPPAAKAPPPPPQQPKSEEERAKEKEKEKAKEGQ